MSTKFQIAHWDQKLIPDDLHGMQCNRNFFSRMIFRIICVQNTRSAAYLTRDNAGCLRPLPVHYVGPYILDDPRTLALEGISILTIYREKYKISKV